MKILFSFFVDSEVKRKFKVKTADDGTNMSKMLEYFIREYLRGNLKIENKKEYKGS